jgi:hypothetical protein
LVGRASRLAARTSQAPSRFDGRLIVEVFRQSVNGFESLRR